MAPKHDNDDEGTLLVPHRAIQMVYITVFLDMLGTYISNPVIPFFAQEFAQDLEGSNCLPNSNSTNSTSCAEHSTQLVGYLFTAPAVAAVLSAGLLGRFSDRFGRRPTLVLSLCGAAIASVMQASATNFWVLLGARFCFGIWTNSMVTAQVYLSDVSTGKERTHCLAQITAIKQLSMFFGPGLGGVLSKWGYNIPIIFDGVVTAIAACFVFCFLDESPEWLRVRAARIEAPNALASDVSSPAAPTASEPAPRGFWILLGPTWLNAAVLVNMNMTLAIFAYKAHGLDPFHVGFMYLGACVITILISKFLTKWLQGYFGLYPLAYITIAGQGVCLMFMAFMDSTFGFVFFYMLSRCFACVKLAVSAKILSDFTSTSNRGRLFGIKTQVENIANIATPPVMGYMSDVEPTSPWVFCAVACVLGALGTALVRPAPQRKIAEPLLA